MNRGIPSQEPITFTVDNDFDYHIGITNASQNHKIEWKINWNDNNKVERPTPIFTLEFQLDNKEFEVLTEDNKEKLGLTKLPQAKIITTDLINKNQITYCYDNLPNVTPSGELISYQVKQTVDGYLCEKKNDNDFVNTLATKFSATIQWADVAGKEEIRPSIEQVKDIFKDEAIFEYFFISAYILKINFYEVLEDKGSILLAEEVRKNLGVIEDSCPMNDPKFEGILKKYKSNIRKDFTCILKKQNLLRDSVYLKNDLILTSYIRVLTALYLKSSDFNQKMYYATTLLSIMMKTEKGGTVLIDTFVETKWDSEADIDLNSCPFDEVSSNSSGPKEYEEAKSRSVIFLSSLFKFVIKYDKSKEEHKNCSYNYTYHKNF